MKRPVQALAVLAALLVLQAGPAQAQPRPTRLGPDTMHLLRMSNTPSEHTALTLNWSGYAVQGKVKDVEGTFAVPSQFAGNGYTSEWVGVDGYNDQDLIQAGVTEQNTYYGIGDVDAWWEIIPGDSVPIAMTVGTGDVVSVGIRNEGKGKWEVSVLDGTSGQYWRQEFNYNGPALSAEWIVEAPTVSGQIASVLPVQPVVWTNLSVQGHAGILDDIWLAQDGMLRFVPSSVESARQLVGDGFTVAYIGS